MAALDTNVLVRYLVADDAAQSAAARRLIESAAAAGQPLFVPVTVALELEWVLRSNFGYTKPEVIDTLLALMVADELAFESEQAIEFALARYARLSADFADCVHASLAAQAGQQPLWTFDKAASKIDGADLLV